MNGLNKVVTIDPQFTAKQWGLYERDDLMFDAAYYLNLHLKNYVNLHKMDKSNVRLRMQFEMNQFAEYGAADSEPMQFLEKILAEIFG